MATYNDGKGYQLGTGAAHVAAGINKVSAITVDLDFAAITTARSAAGLTALAAGDVLEVIKVPANTLVTSVVLNVTTAEGGTLTVDVGDGTDPDGYLDGVNANAAAATLLLRQQVLLLATQMVSITLQKIQSMLLLLTQQTQRLCL